MFRCAAVSNYPASDSCDTHAARGTTSASSKKRATSIGIRPRRKDAGASLRIVCGTVIIRSPRALSPIEFRTVRRAHRSSHASRTTSSSRRWRVSRIGRSVSCANGTVPATRCRRWSRRTPGCGTPEKSLRRTDHRGEVAPDRRADRRCRPRADGRRRALQRRPRRADHRHQHGLPGEEGLQRRRGLGAARPTSRWSRRSSMPSCARSTYR